MAQIVIRDCIDGMTEPAFDEFLEKHGLNRFDDFNENAYRMNSSEPDLKMLNEFLVKQGAKFHAISYRMIGRDVEFTFEER